jgi:hypothetical protein
MPRLNYAARSKVACPRCLWAIGGLMCIALVTVGVLGLSSCAHTPAGLKQEADLYATTTNVVALVAATAANLPPPVGTVFNCLVVGSGALLGIWLHNLEKRLKVAMSNGDAAGSTGPPGDAAGQAKTGA